MRWMLLNQKLRVFVFMSVAFPGGRRKINEFLSFLMYESKYFLNNQGGGGGGREGVREGEKERKM